MVRNGSVLTPKRRGRPPKSVATIMQVPQDTCVTTKRRRGRPSKATSCASPTSSQPTARKQSSSKTIKSAQKLYFVYNFDADATFIVLADDGQTARTQVYDMMRSGVKLDAFDNLQEIANKKGCSARVLLKTELINHVKDNIYHMN